MELHKNEKGVKKRSRPDPGRFYVIWVLHFRPFSHIIYSIMINCRRKIKPRPLSGGAVGGRTGYPMKKTQIIETIRTIGKQKVSYISIILIAFLAVTSFTGIQFASKGLADSGSAYYDRQNFRDLEIVSAVMFSEKDLKKLAAVEGVQDVEGLYRTSGKVIDEDEKIAVSVLSVTERINRVEVIEGVLPQAENEIALERDLMTKLGAQIGDTIRLEDTTKVSLLKNTEFKVVGSCVHPDHLVTPNRFGDYVLVSKEAFDQTLLAGRFPYAELVIEKEEGINRFGSDYKQKVAAVASALEELSVTCSREALENTWEQIASVKNNVLDTYLRPMLVFALQTIKGYSEEEAEKAIDELGWSAEPLSPDLDDADLDAGVFTILENVRIKLPEKDNLVRSLYDQLDGQKDALKAFGINLDGFQLSDEWIRDAQERLNQQDLSRYDQILAAVSLWNEGHSRYLSTVRHLAEKDDGGQNFSGVWLTFDASMNTGYTHMEMSTTGIRAIALRFTLLFIVVAAIVIYATVGKLVDEQKKLVGVTKAFGFRKGEIFAKYLIFGGSATLIGTALGILGGTFLLQYFVGYSYGRSYLSGIPSRTVIVWQILVIVAAGLLLAFAAVLFASVKLLKSTAISLMQGSLPSGRKKQKGSRRSKGSLYPRLIVRNMRTDIKRIVVTIVSIAGCCALILIGFSIYFSLDNTVNVQYGSIIKYDSVAAVEARADEAGVEQVEKALAQYGAGTVRVRSQSGAFRVGAATEPAAFIAADLNALPDFLHLRDAETGETLTEDSGVLIPSSYAKAYGLKVGDTCILIDSAGAAHTAPIGGIYEFYLGQTIVLGPKGYQEVFGEEYAVNALLVKQNGNDREELALKLKEVDGYESLARADELKVIYDGYSNLIGIMMVILIGAAGLMSAVILTNLVNICILQKKRELTIMRVNGFTTKEVKNYITREAIATSAAGVLLGTGIGLLQFRTIMPALGRTYTTFIMTPNIAGILIAAAITVLFTFVIYRLALRKVKNLKLSDVA